MDTQSFSQNPWLTIWVKPRETIRSIINSDPEEYVIMLAMLAGIAHSLNKAMDKAIGDTHSFTTAVAVILIAGSIGGILTLYLYAMLLCLTGRVFRGKASVGEVRAAVAWSSVPTIWALMLWIPPLALFGKDMFTSDTPTIDAHPFLATIVLGSVVFIAIIIHIWTFVVLLKCLGEVHGFSAWKSLGTVITSVLVIVIPIFILIFTWNHLTLW